MSCTCTFGVPHDRVLGRAATASSRSSAVLEHLRPAVHRVERRPQLVRQHRHELVLGAIGAFRGLPREPLLAEEFLALGLAGFEVGCGGGQRGGDFADFLDRGVGRPQPLLAADRFGGARSPAMGRVIVRATHMAPRLPRTNESSTPPP